MWRSEVRDMDMLNKRDLTLLIVRSAEAIAGFLLDHMEPDSAKEKTKRAARALRRIPGTRITASPPRG